MVHVVLMVLENPYTYVFCNPYSPFVWRMSGVVDVHCGECPLWWLSYIVDIVDIVNIVDFVDIVEIVDIV